jgi:soluble cytochrome b562
MGQKYGIPFFIFAPPPKDCLPRPIFHAIIGVDERRMETNEEGVTMPTVQVRDEYAAILEPLQESVDEALRRYAIEKVQARILELERKVQKWEEKYGCSYDLLAYRTATDEEYVKQLDADPSTQQWEGDLLSWEFDVEELREWRRHLHRLLT